MTVISTHEQKGGNASLSLSPVEYEKAAFPAAQGCLGKPWRFRLRDAQSQYYHGLQSLELHRALQGVDKIKGVTVACYMGVEEHAMAAKHPSDSQPLVLPGGRPAALKPEQIAVLHDIVTERAQASLQEIAAELHHRCGVRVCDATIRRTLRAQAIVRLKPVRQAHAERAEGAKRYGYRDRINARETRAVDVLFSSSFVMSPCAYFPSSSFITHCPAGPGGSLRL